MNKIQKLRHEKYVFSVVQTILLNSPGKYWSFTELDQEVNKVDISLSANDVRLALWDLIDIGQATITEDRKIASLC